MVPDVVVAAQAIMWCRTLVAAQAIEQGLESRREWLNTNVESVFV